MIVQYSIPYYAISMFEEVKFYDPHKDIIISDRKEYKSFILSELIERNSSMEPEDIENMLNKYLPY